MKHYLIFIFTFLVLTLNAQENKLVIEGVEHLGTRVNNGMIDFESANAILVPTETLKKIFADLKYYQILAHEDSIKIAEFKKIIETSENFEKNADSLINNHRELIKSADSLYIGYKDLYFDLKKLYDISTFSITPVLGLVNIPDIDQKIRLGFSFGLQRRKTNLNVLLGKKYQGLTFGYRISF